MTDVEKSQADSDRLRLEGNEWFKLGKHEKAIVSYTAAIEAHPTAALYCNRAFCNIKLFFSGEALSDVEEALKLDKNNAKAHYRAGQAYLQLGKVKQSRSSFQAVLNLIPQDADAQAKFKAVDKEYKRIKFLEAIESENSIPLYEKLKPAEMKVPDAYQGPKLDDELTVTAEYVQAMTEHFRDQKLIPKRDIIAILIQAINIMRKEPNVVRVSIPDDQEVTVCGDTHGQFYDLLNIFTINGVPSRTNRYVFNGDFVDRGSYSLENVTTLLAYKVLYPEHFFLSRGNHESLNLNRMYGFEGEVKTKYDQTLFELFQDVFHMLPLAHLLNGKVFVTHGGLFSRDNVTIDDIQKEYRMRDLPEDGLMVDMLWSDPHATMGRAKNKRGVGVAFGPDVTKNFCDTNNLSMVVRSHEVTEEGYQLWHDDRRRRP